jgi:hypothetical protein
MPRPGRFTSGKDLVPIVWEVGWAPVPVWTGAEILAPHRDSIPIPSSPERVACRLNYPGPHFLPDSCGTSTRTRIVEHLMKCQCVSSCIAQRFEES